MIEIQQGITNGRDNATTMKKGEHMEQPYTEHVHNIIISNKHNNDKLTHILMQSLFNTPHSSPRLKVSVWRFRLRVE